MITVEQIHELKGHAETFWSGLHDKMEKDYTEVDEGPGVTLTVDDESIECVNPRIAGAKVAAATNHLIDGDLDVEVDKHARSPMAKQRGVRIAEALKAIHYHSTVSAPNDPHRSAIYNATAMGMGVFFVGVDFSRLDLVEKQRPERDKGESEADFEQRMDLWRDSRDAAFPVVLDHDDPRTIFPDPATYGQLWVMKVERRTVAEVRRNWRGWEPKAEPGKPDKNDFDEVEWFELWSAPGGLSPDDPGVYYYEADGVPIKRFGTSGDRGEEREFGQGPWEHKLGFCPYVVWNAGYGTPTGKPESVFKSLVRNAREANLFRAKAKRMTQIDAIMDKAAWPGTMVPQGMGEGFEVGLGAVNEMPVDQQGRMVEAKWTEIPAVPPSVLQAAAEINQEIDAATISSVLSAPGDSSADVALLFARQVQEAGTALGPLKRNAERAYDQVWQRIGRIMASHDGLDDEDFNLVGTGLDGSTYVASVGRRLFKGNHIYRTKIDPRLPEDQAGKINTGLSMVARGVLSPIDMLRDYAGNPNPEDAWVEATAVNAVTAALSGNAQGLAAQFAMQWILGKVAKDGKLSEFAAQQKLQEEQAAQQQAMMAAQQQSGGGVVPGAGGGADLAATNLQTPNASGAPMFEPGSPLGEVGASQALGEQTVSNRQGAF